MNEKHFYTITAFALLGLSAFAVFRTINRSPYPDDMKSTQASSTFSQEQKVSTQQQETTHTLLVGDKELTVTVADNSSERAQGLSGRESLAADEGMLFIYDRPTYPGFWMYDMNFDLDMIWILENQVIDITENVPAPPPGTPKSQLNKYYPDDVVDMILEVNAGYSQKNNIQIGDTVELVEN